MKTIQEMAREAGWDAHHAEFDTRIERFAELVREEAQAEERNACIEAVEKSRVIEFVVYPKDYMISRNDVTRCYAFQHARSIEAIRARSNT